MRLLSFRLIVSLIVGITLVSLAFSYNEVRVEKRGLRKDLEHRAEVLAESLAGNIEPRLEKESQRQLQRIVEQFGGNPPYRSAPIVRRCRRARRRDRPPASAPSRQYPSSSPRLPASSS